MVSGFWKKLKRPIYALAPMANVTDVAFRRIIAKYGKPDVMWTEFVSCDGLCSKGKDAIMIDLEFSKAERPIVAQVFGATPENFYKTALLLQELGFDGIDINMGCPDRSVEKQGAGAKLMLNIPLAQEIIAETKRGAGKLPVSVKTRLGYNKNNLNEWLPRLLEAEPAAIIIHARTRKEMSEAPARWEEIGKAVEIRDAYDDSENKTLIIGNGDIKDLEDADKKIKQTKADGAMIGRGIFGNPWLFRDCHSRMRSPNCHPERSKAESRDPSTRASSVGMTTGVGTTITTEEKLRVMVEHTYLFEKLLSEHKNFDIMKKHFKAYVNGFDGAKELRIKLMATKNAAEVERVVNEHFLV